MEAPHARLQRKRYLLHLLSLRDVEEVAVSGLRILTDPAPHFAFTDEPVGKADLAHTGHVGALPSLTVVPPGKIADLHEDARFHAQLARLDRVSDHPVKGCGSDLLRLEHEGLAVDRVSDHCDL